MKNLTINDAIKQVSQKNPTAFITIGRQRVKQYDNSIVYLKNQQEFEIELFNPTQTKVLAQIELNGQSIGNGIVIKPGQRAYLERYINDSKKFLFETYEIDSSDSGAVAATLKNGLVKIQFYQEFTNDHWNVYFPYNSSITYINTTPVYFSGNVNLTSSTLPKTTETFAGTTNSTLIWTNVKPSNVFANINDISTSSYFSSTINDNSIETGRVEKGSYSSQKFDRDNSSYWTVPSWTVEWKMLPESRKAVEVKELAIYCTECGAKRKKQSHKFCPHCGTKF